MKVYFCKIMPHAEIIRPLIIDAVVRWRNSSRKQVFGKPSNDGIRGRSKVSPFSRHMTCRSRNAVYTN